MINNVVLVGRLTRDLELRYTTSNKAAVNFTLAVNRNFKKWKRRISSRFYRLYSLWKTSGEYGTLSK